MDAVGKGTDEERRELDEVLWKHCLCSLRDRILDRHTCSVHSVLRDQRVLDHLLVMRRLRSHLTRSEFSVLVDQE
jgi:hypothetical protein